MSKLVVERFDGGMSDDRYEYSVGGYSVAKGFDVLTYPHRLVPTRSTTTDTSSTGIGNLIVGSDGVIYGLGADSGNPTTNTQLYKKPDNATGWSALSNEKTGSGALNFDLFMEYPDIGGSRTIICAKDNSSIALLDKSNVASVNTQALTFNSISQGFIHPKDDFCYIPYTTTTGTFIGYFDTSGTWHATALTIPGTYYVVTGISYYGNYLAIACAPRTAFTFANTGKIINNSFVGGSFKSIVILWDRDTSLNTVSEIIDWGTGIIQLLNNINGRLVGISAVGGGSTNIIDRDSISIKEWAGGVPQLVKEFSTERQTTTAPSARINPFVNFIYRNRLYFSMDIVGGSTSPNYYGLWSLGISKDSNHYALTIERGATTDNSETSVLAAAALGDYFSIVYTASGTIGFSANNSSLTTPFSATSFYESCINPGMLLNRNTRMHWSLVKNLSAVSVAFYPLINGQTISLYYRVDSNLTWTLITTYTFASIDASTSDSDTNSGFERTKENGVSPLTAGRFFEFRLESTGGAQILELAYKYEILNTVMDE